MRRNHDLFWLGGPASHMTIQGNDGFRCTVEFPQLNLNRQWIPRTNPLKRKVLLSSFTVMK